ncbi:MAG: glycine cleavage system aminomethyltransferase GcvT [Candidatus Methylacidiphilales bacterium]|nr:glycine cleavage system aminomethyltransferase GcvT [Candidatus Methylacidiphilales bacterium]
MPSADSKPRQTPLYTLHKAAGAKLIEFGGWEMPVHYTSILEEHAAVRNTVGLFDISHMGQVFVSGTSSEAWLNTLLTNDVRQLSPGQGQYTLMLNESAGVVDDLLVFRLDDQNFLLVVNAARTERDLKWMKKWLNANATLDFDPDHRAALALQGPRAVQVIQKVFPDEFHAPKRNAIETWAFNKQPVLVSRTGYTGEDGFELFFSDAIAEDLWKALLKEGRGLGCVPIGLGARDTLRLEAGLSLYGHELDETITPLEAGLSSFVSFDKPEKFIGREVLREQRENGPARKLIAFEVTGPGAPPRADYIVLKSGRPIGKVTSGGLSPTLRKGIGLALVETPEATLGNTLEIQVRGNTLPAVIVKRPFYRKPE